MAEFKVVLEIKTKGANLFNQPWMVRTFILSQQNLCFYEGDLLLGFLYIKNAKFFKILPEQADGKHYPFKMDNGDQTYLFNASREDIREKCIVVLNYAAIDPNWFDPFESEDESINPLPSIDDIEDTLENFENQHNQEYKNGLKIFEQKKKSNFDPINQSIILKRNSDSSFAYDYANYKENELKDLAALKFQSLYYMYLVKKRMKEVKKSQPILINVNVLGVNLHNKLENSRWENDFTIYVCGLKCATKDSSKAKDPLKELPVTMSKLGYFDEDNTLVENAMVSFSSALDYLSVLLTPSNQVSSSNKILGVGYLDISSVQSNDLDYRGFLNAKLKLQDYSGPEIKELKLADAPSKGHKAKDHTALENAYKEVSIDDVVPGDIQISLEFPDMVYNYCGWVWKMKGSMVSHAWVKRWMVIYDGCLQYYDDIHKLEVPKHIVACKDIFSIDEEKDYTSFYRIKVRFKTENTRGEWHLKWESDQDSQVRRRWVRTLFRNCPSLRDPTIEESDTSLITTVTKKSGVHDHAGAEHHRRVSSLKGVTMKEKIHKYI